jgi:hypothetical protein
MLTVQEFRTWASTRSVKVVPNAAGARAPILQTLRSSLFGFIVVGLVMGQR